MDQLSKIGPFAALIRLWNEMNNSQRVVVVAFLAVSAVTVVIIGIAASKPRMVVLFSGLESQDAGAIVQKLTEQKVPYKLSADNTTIEVPANNADDLKLQMATAGLPQGGSSGFELFDKNTFGMTEFEQRVKFIRAIEGELTRTIEHLAPVNRARVLITVPQDKVYESEQEPSKAAIQLTLKRGMPLSDEQIGGIVHLVASSVEGLQPSNITVIDSTGAVLSEPTTAGGGGGAGMTGNQAKLKRQYENELARNLQSMLASILGPDRAVVRVSAELIFDSEQTKSERYEPAKIGGAEGILLSEDKTLESYSGDSKPPTMQDANRAGGPVAGGYNRTQSNVQYQVTKTIKETATAPGKLKRLSVAVLMDDKSKVSVLAIKEAVSAAAGFDATRNDQVTVQQVAFDTSAQKVEEKQAASASKSQLIETIGKNAVAVLLLVGFLFFLRSIVRQIKVQAPSANAPAVVAAAPASMPMAMGDQTYQQPSMDYSLPDASSMEDNLSMANVADAPPREVVQSSPEELAKLIRTWIAE